MHIWQQFCHGPGAADFESRIQRWAFCVRVSLGRCPRLTWTGAFGAKQILSHWDRVGEALTYLSSWNQTEAPVAAVYDRRRRSESAATADRANAHAAAPVVFDARVRLSRSAVGRTRPVARATAVIDRRYSKSLTSDFSSLNAATDFSILSRLNSLSGTSGTISHLPPRSELGAGRIRPAGGALVSPVGRDGPACAPLRHGAREAVAAVYDRRRRLVHFSK